MYTIRAKNPDTGESIKWSGKDHINPIMLDFVNRTPYLVVVPWSVYSDMKPYGCPNPPYAFIRYDGQSAGWIPIPWESAPKVLRRANLSASHNGFFMKGRRIRMTQSGIKNLNTGIEHSTNGFFQSVFPEDL